MKRSHLVSLALLSLSAFGLAAHASDVSGVDHSVAHATSGFVEQLNESNRAAFAHMNETLQAAVALAAETLSPNEAVEKVLSDQKLALSDEALGS